jgi:hypothetical protein
MAIRGDNSILVTVANHQELWYIPPPSGNMPVDPMRNQLPLSATTLLDDTLCLSLGVSRYSFLSPAWPWRWLHIFAGVYVTLFEIGGFVVLFTWLPVLGFGIVCTPAGYARGCLKVFVVSRLLSAIKWIIVLTLLATMGWHLRIAWQNVAAKCRQSKADKTPIHMAESAWINLAIHLEKRFTKIAPLGSMLGPNGRGLDSGKSSRNSSQLDEQHGSNWAGEFPRPLFCNELLTPCQIW